MGSFKWLMMALAGGVAMTATAAVNITENTVLQADTDWSDQGVVTIAEGATLNLNGYKLKIAGLDCAGTITNDVAYRRLDYIESTGTQWIDTGFVTTDQTAIDFDFTVLTDNGNTAYFCGDWAKKGHLFVGNSTGMNFFGEGAALSAFTANVHRRLVTIPGGAKTVILYNADTGAEVGSSNVALTHTGTCTMTLFAANNDGSKPVDGYHPSSYRLHSFKLTHEGTVVRDMVPVEWIADGVGGLYDRANQVFYPSTGSSDFVKGPVSSAHLLELDVTQGGTFTIAGKCAVPAKVGEGSLTADVDLRAFGDGIDYDGEVYLNGYRLSVATVSGNEKIANVVPTYRRLDYIESTGTQWIDTGFVTTAETAIDFDFTVLSDNGNKAYFCGDWAEWGHLFVGNSTGMNFFGKSNKMSAFTANVHRRLVTIPGGAKTVILYNADTGAEVGSSNVALTHSGTGTMTLFAANNDGANPASYRLHAFKLTHQGTVVRDMVPVERTADGVGGLYDRANQVFYRSTGTGDFVKGAVQGEEITVEDNLSAGEFCLDLPANAQVENSTARFLEKVAFIKAGAGKYIERKAQTNAGGVKLEGGEYAVDTAEPTIAGPLTFAGGSLAVAEGKPVQAGGGVSVTAPSGIVLEGSEIAGKKTAILGFGASTPLDQLTLTVRPSVTCATSLALDGDALQAVLGGAGEVATAVWSGAVDNDVTKPGNWTCADIAGAAVADGLPAAYTTVTLTGTLDLQLPAGTTIPHGELVLDNCTLAADCDWRGLGELTVNGTVDLAGHKLYTAGVAGTGTVTSGNVNGYRFYRFKVDAKGGSDLQISEIQLYCGDLHITPNRTALHWNPTGAFNGYNPDKALDNNTATKWYDQRSPDDLWVTVEYEKPVFVTRYKWFTADDTQKYSGRNPTAWRLQGSNDNSTWTDLHVMTGQTPPAKNKVEVGVWMVNPNQGGDGSELHLEVAPDQVMDLSTVTLANQLKLVKDGAGTLVLSKLGQTFGGGIEVAAGYLKPGQRDDGSIFGGSCATITVDSGAQFLDEIFSLGASCDVHWVIAGEGPDGLGAIRSPTRTPGRNNATIAWGRSLTLTDDATIGNDEYAFDFIAPNYKAFQLTLNNHTLTLKSEKTKSERQYPYFLFSNVQGTDSGTIVVGKNLQFFPYEGEAGCLPQVTLVISESAEYSTEKNTAGKDLTVSNLIYRSTSTLSQTAHTTYVLGRYAPASTTSAPKVLLGDADHLTTTLDLSSQSGAFDCAFGGGLTFFAGSTVKVDVGSRKLAQMEKIIAWTSVPENVKFTAGNRRGTFIVQEDGLYYVSGMVIILR